MQASGQSIIIQSGDYQARIVTVGAGLSALTWKGLHITLPHDPDTVPGGHLGKVLIPWPNRIKNGRYSFAGKDYQLAVTELSTGSASHGFVAWKDWEIFDLAEDAVTLSTCVVPQPNYPFLLLCYARYELSEAGLKVTLTAINIGKQAAPYGVGQHPYISCNLKPLDECTLSFPCQEVWAVDEKMCPTELVSAESLGLDFCTERSLKDVHIDHAFKNEQDPLTVCLKTPEVTVKLVTSAPFVQLFTAEKLKRQGLAVEPMSCPANAFNSGVGLTVLQPAQSHVLSYTISAECA